MGTVRRSRSILGADADLDYDRAEEQVYEKRIEVRLGPHPVRASDQWVSSQNGHFTWAFQFSDFIRVTKLFVR